MSGIQDRFRAIVSGKGKGVATSAIRALLGLTSRGYSVAIAVRNRLYDLQIMPCHRFEIPVISVGNITAGGTGKTPLVAWLFGQLIEVLHIDPGCIAILTRGYRSGGNSDEPLLLKHSCEGGLVIVDPDRIRGAMTARAKGARILILDDGFQHRRLARDLDILTIDATCPFGYERILPAGLLREPVGSIKRAQAAVITRMDQVQQQQLEDINRRLKAIRPDLIICYARHTPTCIITRDGRSARPDLIACKRIAAFCGIGNPDAFFQTLQGLGAIVVAKLAFADHHRFTARDIAYIQAKAYATGAQMIVTTTKNWLALDPAWFDTDLTVGHLEVRLEITSGEGQLIQVLEAATKGKA